MTDLRQARQDDLGEQEQAIEDDLFIDIMQRQSGRDSPQAGPIDSPFPYLDSVAVVSILSSSRGP